MAPPPVPEDADPISQLQHLVTRLEEVSTPTLTLSLERYEKAAENWGQVAGLVRGSLAEIMSEVRRWVATRLAPGLHPDAARDVDATEEAIKGLVDCPIPRPLGPPAWHVDADGRRHTPIGATDESHSLQCRQLSRAALTARQAADRMARWKAFLTPATLVESPPVPPLGTKKAKRSTTRGSGRVKLIAALTKHHKYDDGSCLVQDPISVRKLAKAADVTPSTASELFKSKFKGHDKYVSLCKNKSLLIASLKALNADFAPYELYGALPPGEAGRNDD